MRGRGVVPVTARIAHDLRHALERAADPSCSESELARAVAVVDPSDFVELCIKNRIAGVVCDRVGAANVLDDEHLHPLLSAQANAQLRHLQTLRVVAEVAEALTVPWLVIKGPVLASHWYKSGVRQYNDLDIVVHPADFGTATAELERLGFEVQTRNWDRYLEAQMAEIQFKRDDLKIDLHWDLQPVGELRVEMLHDRARWLRRAMPVSLAGVEVQTLSPEDTLLHLCLHGALSGGDVLVYLTDVRAVIDRGIDWDRFVRLAVTAGTPACVHGILDRAKRTVSADVPTRVLRVIAGPPLWGPIFRMVDRAPRGENRFNRCTPSSSAADGRPLKVAHHVADPGCRIVAPSAWPHG